MPCRVLLAATVGVIFITAAGCSGDGTSTTSNAASHPVTPRTSTLPTPGSPTPTSATEASASNGENRVKMTAHPNCELPGSSEFFMPELNLWRADAAHRTTIVCAGGASNDKPGAGRFLIIRSSAGARESVDQVTVPGVGPVKITKAPRGPHAATRGQTHGNIEFRAHDGSTGTLHLEDDTVTVDPKSNRLTADSTCDEIPAGHVSKAMVKKWLLKLSVVRAVERMQNGWVARNVGDLQAYCQSHPAAGLDHATAVILHSDPAR